MTVASTAELSSVASAVEELAKRVTVMAESTAKAKREDVAGDLFEVERLLLNAHRRLAKLAER